MVDISIDTTVLLQEAVQWSYKRLRAGCFGAISLAVPVRNVPPRRATRARQTTLKPLDLKHLKASV